MKLFRIAAILSSALLLLSAGAAAAQGRPQPLPPQGGFDVGVRKTAVGPVVQGQPARFSIQVSNNGQGQIPGNFGITVTDTLSGVFGPPISASGPGWTCTVVGQVVTCRYTLPLAPGAVAPPITITATPRDTGSYSNCASVTLNGPVPDSNASNNRSCIDGPIAGGGQKRHDLALRKLGPGPVKIGQPATFQLLVLNRGPAVVNSASGVQVVDTLPANFSPPVTAGGSGWFCQVSYLTVTCTYNGPPVAAGGSLPPIAVTATVRSEGAWRNCATVRLRVGEDTNPGDNTGCVDGVAGGGGNGRIPDLSIRKTGPGPVTVGQPVSFGLQVTNNGPGPVSGASGIQVVDQLPAGFTGPVSASGAGWTCVVSGSGPFLVTCNYVGGPFPAGAQLPLITVSATAGGQGGYVNCANVKLVRGPDADPKNDRSCVEGPIKPKAGKIDVGIKKSGPGVVPYGQTGTFTLNPYNTGPATITSAMGLVVTDTLPINFGGPVSANGSPDWNCSVSGSGNGSMPPFTVTCVYVGNNAAPGSSMGQITITAVGRGYGTWDNCANIVFRQPAGNLSPVPDVRPADNTSCVKGEVVKAKKYDVRIQKKGPGPVIVGQTATFTLYPANVGPTPVDSNSGVVVTDSLPAPPFSAPVTVNGGSDWDCSATVGLNVSCLYRGPAVGAGAALPTITIDVLVRKPGSYVNCAVIALTKVGPDANPQDNRSCVEGPSSEQKKVDVGIKKSGPGVVPYGQTGTFTLNPYNTGPATITSTMGLVVTDTLPVNFGGPVTVNGSPDWGCTVAGSGNGSMPPFTVTCVYVGNGATPGSSMSPITITAVGRGYGTWSNCANIVFKQPAGNLSTVPDVAPADNRSCIKGEVVKAEKYDVKIDKKLQGPLVVGGLAGFTLYPTNVGPATIDMNSGVYVTDTLQSPPFGTPVTWAASSAWWDCSASSGLTVSCHYIGPARAAGVILPPISITSPVIKGGGFVNCAEIVIKAGTDINPKDNRSCVEGPIGGKYNLSLGKRALGAPWPHPGGGVYRLVVVNNGPTAIPAGTVLTITDPLPAGMKFTGSVGPWTCTPVGAIGPASITCTYTLPGALSPTANIGVDLNMVFVGGPTDGYTNCAVLSAGVTETTLEDNKGCDSFKPKVFDLLLNKTATASPWPYPGGGVFTLTVTNNGPSFVPNGDIIKIVDQIPAGMKVTVVSTGWNCTPALPVTGPVALSCTRTLTANLAAGASTALQLTTTLTAPQQGSYNNCAQAAALMPTGQPEAEANFNNNQDCEVVTTRLPQAPSLSVSKALAGPCQNNNGTVICTFVFTVTNNGTGAYSGTVSLADTIAYAPAAGTVVSNVTGGWSCVAGAPSNCQGPVSLPGGTSTSFSATFTVNGPVIPTQNCVQLTAPTTNPLLGPSCVPIVFQASTPPVLDIEKVMEQDCNGSYPNIHCKFVIRIFNLGPGGYFGPLTFTDLVTSFGNVAGGVSLVAPYPPGWTCTGVQPMTCTNPSVGIAQGAHATIPIWMDINSAIPVDLNCATLTGPQQQPAPKSCVGLHAPQIAILLDSNFMPDYANPSLHRYELSYYVNPTPDFVPGNRVFINGTLTSNYVPTNSNPTFSAMVMGNSPTWTCTNTAWSGFSCYYDIPASYTGGSVVMKVYTTYQAAAVGSSLQYTGTATVQGNTDPPPADETRIVNGTLF
ncbi:MAG: hypothetical protein JWR84_1143 [Caulobacter sp.]|nr:hypothetical protein [Caulobacter sp.]